MFEKKCVHFINGIYSNALIELWSLDNAGTIRVACHCTSVAAIFVQCTSPFDFGFSTDTFPIKSVCFSIHNCVWWRIYHLLFSDDEAPKSFRSRWNGCWLNTKQFSMILNRNDQWQQNYKFYFENTKKQQNKITMTKMISTPLNIRTSCNKYSILHVSRTESENSWALHCIYFPQIAT